MKEAPHAAPGSRFASYRYKGPYGHILIAAHDHYEAEREARRSTSVPIERHKLEVWDGERFVPAAQCDNPPRA